jgi:mannose-6-phosphate isomerase-like protein (cupin superfamily)
MSELRPRNLSSTYLRLRPDASVEHLPVDDRFWERIGAGELGDFRNEYLVSSHTFASDWPVWEMHPKGDEVVCLLSGAATFLLEHEDGARAIELKDAGAYVVVPKGTWHTARTQGPCRMLFITAGEGTQHREAVFDNHP